MIAVRPCPFYPSGLLHIAHVRTYPTGRIETDLACDTCGHTETTEERGTAKGKPVGVQGL